MQTSTSNHSIFNSTLSHLPKPIAEVIYRTFKLNEVDVLFNLYKNLPAEKFMQAILQHQNIEYTISSRSLQIPAQGGFVLISNHPFGFLDGILLLNTLIKIRPDVKVLANEMLSQIEPLKEYLIPLNPIDNKNSVSATKKAIEHLKKGSPLIVFPAGEVSTRHKGEKYSMDKTWLKGCSKIVKIAKVPVIPTFIEGENSQIFHLLGKVHPLLRTAKIPSEFLHQKFKKVKIKFGNIILSEQLNHYATADALNAYLRTETYVMSDIAKKRQGVFHLTKDFKKKQRIAPPLTAEKIKDEVENLPTSCLLLSKGNFKVYLASANQLRYTLVEIGRLRELTFRRIGEGTNKALDLDEYDEFYQHLFVWNNEHHEVVGAYRLGIGKDILPVYGRKGFYTSSLFKYKQEFKPVLAQSIELGRSFVKPKYQKKLLPLLLLWDGIRLFANTLENTSYFLGPVSISNTYSAFSKEVILQFLENHCMHDNYSKLCTAKNKYRYELSSVVPKENLTTYARSLKDVNHFIKSTDNHHNALPVLIRKYLGEDARVLAFNVDKKFNNAIDVLTICKI